MEDLTGKQLGSYQVVAPLGEGGMAAVYKAFQPGMERYVALKILPRHFASDPEFVGRFEQEAKVVARLQHPHILPVFDYGRADGYTFIAMPYLQNGDLTDLIRRGTPLSLAEVRRIVSQVGDALDYAHSRGLIHRDVKPSNVLLDERGNCLLSDFGITKIVEGTAHFTATGGFVGTPAYMSPEQGLGRKLDGRSDIYALGIMLYEMVTGRVPYRAETPMAVVVKHIHDPLPPPRQLNSTLPEAVETVILKALAKPPEDRFATAGDMVRALQAAIPDTLLADTLVPPEVATMLSSGSTAQTGDHVVAGTVSDRRSSSGGWILGLGLAALVVIVGTIVFFLAGGPSAVGTGGDIPAVPADSTNPEAAAQSSSASGGAEPEGGSETLNPALYDDFNDPAYDGGLNTSKWLVDAHEDCTFTQQDGALVVENRPPVEDIGCNLIVGRPTYVSFEGLGVVEAKMRVSADHSSEPLNQHLVFASVDDADAAQLWASCGLHAEEQDVVALVAIDTDKPEMYQEIPIEADRWYTFRFEAEPETGALNCLVDGRLLGSLVPSNAAQLADARFQRQVAVWRSPGAMATTYVDDVRLEAAKTALVPAEASVFYDDFKDPAFEGKLNLGLWSPFDGSDVSDISQKGGVLTIVRRGEPESAAGLEANAYREKSIDRPTFFEASFMVEEGQDGHAYLFIGSDLPSEDYSDCTLGYGDEEAASIECGYYIDEESAFWSGVYPADFGAWHQVRIEVDPEPMEFSYFIDGRPVGRYVPPNADELKDEARFYLDIGAWGASTEAVTVHFDDVRIGPVE